MPPANDNFASATVLSGSSGSVTFSNVGATVETGEPGNGIGDTAQGTVWFAWTPPAGGVFVRTGATPSPTWDSIIAVYSGSSLATLTWLATGDDNDLQPPQTTGYGTGKAEWTADGTTTYYIQVGAFDDVTGPPQRNDLILTYDVAPPPPPPPPTITHLAGVDDIGTAHAGRVGSALVITGTNLSYVTSVTVAGGSASFTIDSGTQITATVPYAHANTDVVVSDAGGTATASPFTVLFPGTWVQPSDRWSNSLDAAGTIVERTRTYDATSTLTADTGWATTHESLAAFAGQQVDTVRDIYTTVTGWTVRDTIGLLGWALDNMLNPTFGYLPDVDPTPTDLAPADVWSYEFETVPANLTGPVEAHLIEDGSTGTLTTGYIGARIEAPPGTTTEPPDTTEMATSHLAVSRAPTSNYAWSSGPVNLGDPDPAVISAGEIVDPQVTAAGTVTNTATDVWSAVWAPGVVISLTTSDLDNYDGVTLGLVLFLATSFFLAGTNAAFTGTADLKRAGTMLATSGEGGVNGRARAMYRPRRWRLLYTDPQVTAAEFWGIAEGDIAAGTEIWG